MSLTVLNWGLVWCIHRGKMGATSSTFFTEDSGFDSGILFTNSGVKEEATIWRLCGMKGIPLQQTKEREKRKRKQDYLCASMCQCASASRGEGGLYFPPGYTMHIAEFVPREYGKKPSSLASFEGIHTFKKFDRLFAYKSKSILPPAFDMHKRTGVDPPTFLILFFLFSLFLGSFSFIDTPRALR